MRVVLLRSPWAVLRFRLRCLALGNARHPYHEQRDAEYGAEAAADPDVEEPVECSLEDRPARISALDPRVFHNRLRRDPPSRICCQHRQQQVPRIWRYGEPCRVGEIEFSGMNLLPVRLIIPAVERSGTDQEDMKNDPERPHIASWRNLHRVTLGEFEHLRSWGGRECHSEVWREGKNENERM